MSLLVNELRFARDLVRRRPFNVLVQVTNRCNMRCSFCEFPNNIAPPSQELTTEDFRKLGDEMAEVGTFLISIEGGEPFLRPDLVEIVRAFSRKHLTVLYTNGWFVDAASAQALFDAGLSQVGVSVDFPDAARHDRKRGLDGGFERAWKAVEHFRAAAPNGERQVHVMTVLMDENRGDLDALFSSSAKAGVGHCVTMLATHGALRGGRQDLVEIGTLVDHVPQRPVSHEMLALWKKHRHVRMFRDYFARMDSFLEKRADLPVCHAGEQSFNVDHLGNVAPCIEKIDRPAGNVRTERLQAILARMKALPEVAACQDCWTACRGFSQALGRGGSIGAWRDLGTRMRSR